jgi:glutamine---fructose-6-phosphate transaminase (isomerizing)
VGSTSTREADAVLYMRCGPEIGVASTKAFAAQRAALCLLGIALGKRKGKLNAVEIGTLKHFLADLPSLIRQTLKTDKSVRAVANTLVDAKRILYLRRGRKYPSRWKGRSG